jgi:hypothetical protein
MTIEVKVHLLGEIPQTQEKMLMKKLKELEAIMSQFITLMDIIITQGHIIILMFPMLKGRLHINQAVMTIISTLKENE